MERGGYPAACWAHRRGTPRERLAKAEEVLCSFTLIEGKAGMGVTLGSATAASEEPLTHRVHQLLHTDARAIRVAP